MVLVLVPTKPAHSSIKKITKIQSPKNIEVLEKEVTLNTPSVQADNIGSKRVKFNSLIE